MNEEVLRRAAAIERDHGPDVETALTLWERSGAEATGLRSAPWLSVAFIFARRIRRR